MVSGDQLISRRLVVKDEKKMLPNWAFLACFFMVMSFLALLNSSMGPFSIVDFTSLKSKEFYTLDEQHDPIDDTDSRATNNKTQPLQDAKIDSRDDTDSRENYNKTQPPQVICNFALPRSDYCEINGDVRIHGSLSSVYISPSILNNESNTSSRWILRPYARKVDRSVMKKGKVLSLGSPSSFGLNGMPNCSIYHEVPAIVLSAGGYAGNIFHEFSDILIPLYITSKSFNGEVQFLITHLKPKWEIKHKLFLDLLTNYPIIDMDMSNEVHCFKSAIVGLKNHIDFGIDPSMDPQGYSMTNFTKFVRDAYKLKRSKVEGLIKRPRMMIISRKGKRAMLNEDEVAKEAKSLGYDLEVMPASGNIIDFSKVVNSFDVMMGVHGAGLTNSVFLPENAVLIQIVPMGLEWGSRNYYEWPAKSMNLRYLDYKVCRNESSLADEFFVDDPVTANSSSLKRLAWPDFKKYYLDGQNVRIDVKRFRQVLLEAMKLLQQ